MIVIPATDRGERLPGGKQVTTAGKSAASLKHAQCADNIPGFDFAPAVTDHSVKTDPFAVPASGTLAGRIDWLTSLLKYCVRY